MLASSILIAIGDHGIAGTCTLALLYLLAVVLIVAVWSSCHAV